MRTESKNKLMLWIIVLLALMNISTIVTIVYTRSQVKNKASGSSLNQSDTERAAVKFSGRYFRTELGFNRLQMQQFTSFNPGFRRQVNVISLKLSEQRQRMLKEMSAPDADTIRLNQLCDSIGYMHARLKKITYGYFLNIYDICDKSQQLKLEQLFYEVFAGDLQPAIHARGEQMGRQRGRQIQQ